MSQTVTGLVIDADTSGADQFSAAMDHAGASAESGMSSVAGMTLAIAGVGVAVVGAIAGLRSFVDYVGQQTQQLVDLSDHAALAGVSVKELQETLFAARSAGVSDRDFFPASTGFRPTWCRRTKARPSSAGCLKPTGSRSRIRTAN